MNIKFLHAFSVFIEMIIYFLFSYSVNMMNYMIHFLILLLVLLIRSLIYGGKSGLFVCFLFHPDFYSFCFLLFH